MIQSDGIKAPVKCKKFILDIGPNEEPVCWIKQIRLYKATLSDAQVSMIDKMVDERLGE